VAEDQRHEQGHGGYQHASSREAAHSRTDHNIIIIVAFRPRPCALIRNASSSEQEGGV
jgi:hypothetical protein